MDPKEQATKVKEWIDSHWRGRGRCPRCGEGNWTVKYVVSLPLTAVPADWTRTDHPVFPVAPVVCGKCGYVIFLDAIAIGVQRAAEG
jgi:ribosomal protein S27AE